MDRNVMLDQCVSWNSPVIPAAINSSSAPQSVGSAVLPKASEGSLSRGEITTPKDHDKEPNNTASNPSKLEPFTVSSAPVSMPTPTTPRPRPSPLSRLIFCCPITQPRTRMNMGSVAISNAAIPEATYCSAQCSVPCPTKKKGAPSANPATHCCRVGRNPRHQAQVSMIPPAIECLIPATTSGGIVSTA